MEIPYTVKPRPDTGLWNAKLGIWLFLASEVMLFGGLFSAYVFLRTGSTNWPHGLLDVPIGTMNTFVLIGSSITIVLSWAALKTGSLKWFKIWMGITIFAGFLFLGVKCLVEYPAKFKHYGLVLKNGTEVTGHLVSQNDEFIELELDPPKAHAAGAEHAKPEEHAAAAGQGAAEGAKVGHNGHEIVKYPREEVRRFSNWGPWYSPYFAIYFLITALHGIHVLAGTCVNIYFWLPGSKMYLTDPEHFANRVEVSGLFWHFVDLVWIFLFPVMYLL